MPYIDYQRTMSETLNGYEASVAVQKNKLIDDIQQLLPKERKKYLTALLKRMEEFVSIKNYLREHLLNPKKTPADERQAIAQVHQSTQRLLAIQREISLIQQSVQKAKTEQKHVVPPVASKVAAVTPGVPIKTLAPSPTTTATHFGVSDDELEEAFGNPIQFPEVPHTPITRRVDAHTTPPSRTQLDNQQYKKIYQTSIHDQKNAEKLLKEKGPGALQFADQQDKKLGNTLGQLEKGKSSVDDAVNLLTQQGHSSDDEVDALLNDVAKDLRKGPGR